MSGEKQTICREGQTMESEIIFLVEDALEGGYQARALGHSIFTEAETVEELREMVQDAVQCHFEESDRPRLIRLHFVKEEVLSV
jgi:hypothetical protein